MEEVCGGGMKQPPPDLSCAGSCAKHRTSLPLYAVDTFNTAPLKSLISSQTCCFSYIFIIVVGSITNLLSNLGRNIRPLSSYSFSCPAHLYHQGL